MTTINLRDYYPWYIEDQYIEVSDEVAAELRADKLYEAAYQRRIIRNKAQYSLDCDDTVSGIGGAVSAVTKIGEIFSSTAGNSVYLTFAKWALIIVAVVAAIALLVAAIGVLTGKGDEMTRTFSSMSGVTDGMTGGVRNGSVNIPGFASGGVFAPNNPMLAVLGDNRTEPEVVAPESMLRDVFADVLDRYGGVQQSQSSGPVNITMVMDGQTMARVSLPYLRNEQVRLGADLLNR